MIIIKRQKGSGLINFKSQRARNVKEALQEARASWVSLRYAVLSNADLRGIDLHGADLTGADLTRTCLSSADLRDAILSGANLSGANLSGANLSGADLCGANLSGADFSGADLSDTDLSDTDLSDARLSSANLSGANLSEAILTGATFGELDLNIPKVEKLDTCLLAAITAEGGGLDMSHWHRTSPSTPACGSTHCRAGWAIHLAGEAGYALERLVDSNAAGALIYAKSTGRRVPDFHASNEDALEDIKRCVALVSRSADVSKPTKRVLKSS